MSNVSLLSNDTLLLNTCSSIRTGNGLHQRWLGTSAGPSTWKWDLLRLFGVECIHTLVQTNYGKIVNGLPLYRALAALAWPHYPKAYIEPLWVQNLVQIHNVGLCRRGILTTNPLVIGQPTSLPEPQSPRWPKLDWVTFNHASRNISNANPTSELFGQFRSIQGFLFRPRGPRYSAKPVSCFVLDTGLVCLECESKANQIRNQKQEVDKGEEHEVWFSFGDYWHHR